MNAGGADSDPAPASGPTAPDAAAGGSSSESPDASPGGPSELPEAGGPSPMPDPGPPSVQFIGRFDGSPDTGMRFAWSGSGVRARFRGTSVSVNLEDSGSNWFSVVIDDQVLSPFSAMAGSNSYQLADGLADGEHQVDLYRRTEANQGASIFHGFDLGNGELLSPPRTHKHRLEVIGDSITCGYGDEGTSASCSFTPDTENHYKSYEAVAARALDAELVTIAWSGKGIVYNYGDDMNEPLPELYDRTIPTEAQSTWDFSFQPEAVVINLGTNDFSTDNDPSAELFHDRYTAFLEHLRSKYPGAFIFCTVGPMLGGDDLDAARSGIDAAIATRNDAGDDRLKAWEMNISNDNPGCDYHPSVATHAAMAMALQQELEAELGW
jgi:lysophospholipase L1-like esterase